MPALSRHRLCSVCPRAQQCRVTLSSAARSSEGHAPSTPPAATTPGAVGNPLSFGLPLPHGVLPPTTSTLTQHECEASRSCTARSVESPPKRTRASSSIAGVTSRTLPPQRLSSKNARRRACNVRFAAMVLATGSVNPRIDVPRLALARERSACRGGKYGGGSDGGCVSASEWRASRASDGEMVRVVTSGKRGEDRTAVVTSI